MEQVLAPRFDFKPKTPETGPTQGYDYGKNGYDHQKSNVGFNKDTGQMQIEIQGLLEPRTNEAKRICEEDINELIAAFSQDKRTIERGIFDDELAPEEITQVAMGKIVAKKYPNLEKEDQEAIRQRAVAAINMTQQVKKAINNEKSNLTEGNQEVDDPKLNTAFLDGVRQFAMDVKVLDVDFIDRINPFGEAYAILAKAMSEDSLRQLSDIINARRLNLTFEEARDLAKELRFLRKRKVCFLPLILQMWEKRMADGMNIFAQMVKERKNNEQS